MLSCNFLTYFHHLFTCKSCFLAAGIDVHFPPFHINSTLSKLKCIRLYLKLQFVCNLSVYTEKKFHIHASHWKKGNSFLCHKNKSVKEFCIWLKGRWSDYKMYKKPVDEGGKWCILWFKVEIIVKELIALLM